MDEPKEKEKGKEKEPEKPAGDTEEGDKPEIYKPIDDANLAAKRLEDANKERRELLDKEEELLAKRALGGRAEGGRQAPAEKPISDVEFSRKVDRGEVNPLAEDGFI
ncbi:hypothetical protein LCGC14_0851850 [marine sediment metagenome]|uniref:Uncharacterized protein n=1 Tax=marine sediment metagenome TaxID=412755 RepID=A0A0F9SH22_9ZZZZ